MWVNLTEGKVEYENVPDEVYEKFLSGYGLGAKMLFDRMPPDADPLGPENILGFCTIWGKDTVETEDFVRKELEDKKSQFKIACIGPASEKLSLISGISNDKSRLAARSGLGAAMGLKKIKALAARGRAKVEARDPEKMKELIRPVREDIKPHTLGYPPIEHGPHAKVTVDLDTMTENFYEAFDWDTKTGKPGRERLEKLGLNEVMDFYG